jgi:N-acetylglucosaminyl-diphospho-decaprenol L-rhamnosyltransferase
MGAPRVWVIIVNYNGGRYLARCLKALQAQTFREFGVTVVDNGSSDGSLEHVRATVADPRFTFRHLGTNLGFAAANNLVARSVGSELLATLNPDAFPEPTWLERLIVAAGRYPDADMFGSTQLNAADPSRLDGTGDVYSFLGAFWRGGYGSPATAVLAPPGEIFSPCAAAALYRTAAFREVGGFDERFFCYCEDVDLGFRLRLRGGRAMHVPDAIVHHIHGASSGGAQSDFAHYHSARNRVWVFVKNMPGPLLWLLAPGHLGLNLLFLATTLRHRHRRAIWRGVRDAVTGLPQTIESRRHAQATRRVSTWAVVRALCWSPGHLLSRAPHQIRR